MTTALALSGAICRVRTDAYSYLESEDHDVHSVQSERSETMSPEA